MIIPKEIREKVEQRMKLDDELDKWFEEYLDIEGCDTRTVAIVDTPSGERQSNGEYCNQVVLGEDWYRGQYYWKMDNGKYLRMNYEI